MRGSAPSPHYWFSPPPPLPRSPLWFRPPRVSPRPRPARPAAPALWFRAGRSLSGDGGGGGGGGRGEPRALGAPGGHAARPLAPRSPPGLLLVAARSRLLRPPPPRSHGRLSGGAGSRYRPGPLGTGPQLPGGGGGGGGGSAGAAPARFAEPPRRAPRAAPAAPPGAPPDPRPLLRPPGRGRYRPARRRARALPGALPAPAAAPVGPGLAAGPGLPGPLVAAGGGAARLRHQRGGVRAAPGAAPDPRAPPAPLRAERAAAPGEPRARGAQRGRHRRWGGGRETARFGVKKVHFGGAIKGLVRLGVLRGFVSKKPQKENPKTNKLCPKTFP